VDLENVSSVVAFANKFKEDGGRLDIFVHNAAVAQRKYTVNEEGYETTCV
jgi:retinol dehydrogenase 12